MMTTLKVQRRNMETKAKPPIPAKKPEIQVPKYLILVTETPTESQA